MSAIYSKLTAHAGLSALVGARIYPGELPRKDPAFAYPAVVYDVDKEAMAAHDEDGEGQFSTVYAEFTVYSRTTALAAEGIADQIRAAFPTVTGSIDGATYTGARFEGADAAVYIGDAQTWALDLRFSVMESA